MFTDEELEGLLPEIGREELFRFFTLFPADVAFLDPSRGRGPDLVSPAHSENINFLGAIGVDVDIEGELAQPGATGHRPLRVADTLF